MLPSASSPRLLMKYVRYTFVAVAEEYVGAVPFVNAKVGVETVGNRIPRHRPAHPRLQALDVGLRSARDVREGRVSCVEVRNVRDLIGHHRAAATGMLGPAVHAGLEERAIDHQLATPFEQVDEADLALGSSRTCSFSRPSSTACGAAPRRERRVRGSTLFLLRSSCRRAVSHSCGDTTGGAFDRRSVICYPLQKLVTVLKTIVAAPKDTGSPRCRSSKSGPPRTGS